MQFNASKNHHLKLILNFNSIRAIHPANIEDFKKGDFRRRKAQRKVRKHMGLDVDEDADSPSPPPLSLSPPHVLFPPQPYMFNFANERILQTIPPIYTQSPRKRQFDVASLLAPDVDYSSSSSKRINLDREQEEEDIDVVSPNDESSGIKKAHHHHHPHATVVASEFRSINYHIPFNMDPRLLNYYHHHQTYQMKQQQSHLQLLQQHEKDNKSGGNNNQKLDEVKIDVNE